MPGLTPHPGSRANSTIYSDEDGHTYLLRSEAQRVRYMYCTSQGCPAHGRDDLGEFTLDVPHSRQCRTNPDILLLNRMKEEMRREAARTGKADDSFREVEQRVE